LLPAERPLIEIAPWLIQISLLIPAGAPPAGASAAKEEIP
jgi:hypothetical protein